MEMVGRWCSRFARTLPFPFSLCSFSPSPLSLFRTTKSNADLGRRHELRARKSIYGRKQAREIVSSKVAVRLALDSGTAAKGNETRIVSPPRPGPLPIMRIRWNTSVDKREHVPPYALQPRIIKLDRQVAPVSRTTVITDRLERSGSCCYSLPSAKRGTAFFSLSTYSRILSRSIAQLAMRRRSLNCFQSIRIEF